jgi:CreA protein
MRLRTAASALIAGALCLATSVLPAAAQEDLIFRKSTVWKMLTPDDKLAVYGVAEQVSEISLACRQIGPIKFKEKADQGDVVFRERRSLVWKKMQIVRGCDAKRNVLVYLVYSDKLIDGSPQNSTSTVPIMPWGGNGDAPKCADWIK